MYAIDPTEANLSKFGCWRPTAVKGPESGINYIGIKRFDRYILVYRGFRVLNIAKSRTIGKGWIYRLARSRVL